MAASLMLLDTASLYFRAFYGVPDTVRSPDGTPVNAVRGFLDMLARLVADHQPDRMLCCLDADWRPAFRVEAIPSYKAHRVASPDGSEDVPAALAVQVPVLMDVLDALGVARLGAAGYEADDVIATVAAHADGPVDVVTGDRDLFAVVNDDRGVRVLYVARGVAKREVVDATEVRRRYGVAPPQYADLAILRGDPSDGLPGVPGIGEKTAADLLRRYGSLDALVGAVAAGDSDVPKRAALAARLDYLTAACRVVPVRTDVPLAAMGTTSLALRRDPADPPRLVHLSATWGLDAPLTRVLAALAGGGRRESSSAHPGTS